MEERVCGIDIGSTNLKVVLVDEAGRCVWVRSVPTPRIAFRGGVATDADALVESVETLILEGWRAAGGGRPLRAIAAAGVGEDGLGLDAQMKPTGPALPWFDTRAAVEAAELARHPDADARIGLRIGADRTLAKWLWLRRHAPELLERAHLWVALTDYPAVRWTGVPFMSRTLAARTAAYDVHARGWILPLLAAAGAPPMPKLLDAGHVVGTFGHGRLRAAGAASETTLVVAGGHDHPVAAAAIRSAVPAARVDSLGTANVLYGETARPMTPELTPGLAYSVPVKDGPGVACLGVIELAAQLTAETVDRAPIERILAAAQVPGLPLPREATPEAAVRRRLEAASLEARRLLRAMDAAGVAPGPLYVTGGWSRSRAFMALRASVLSTPLHVVEEPELTGVSAALLAAEGAGLRIDSDITARVAVVDPVPGWIDAYAAADAVPSVFSNRLATLP